MILIGLLFLALALLGLAATARQLPRDGYGLPRHGIDDWPHRP
ncbi:hypothetical protein [Microbacterium sp. G2-8]|nr:hypothetical protein [Microbacterium sp. G2-8]